MVAVESEGKEVGPPAVRAHCEMLMTIPCRCCGGSHPPLEHHLPKLGRRMMTFSTAGSRQARL